MALKSIFIFPEVSTFLYRYLLYFCLSFFSEISETAACYKPALRQFVQHAFQFRHFSSKKTGFCVQAFFPNKILVARLTQWWLAGINYS